MDYQKPTRQEVERDIMNLLHCELNLAVAEWEAAGHIRIYRAQLRKLKKQHLRKMRADVKRIMAN